MIDEMHIQCLGVIEDATLRLGPGLTVVTGETGAGKTMVVNALQLLLGARADASLVRAGCTAAVVEARLDALPEGDGDEVVIHREISSDSEGRTRSRARIRGRLATVAELTDTLGRWVEVHGQGEHVRLARPDVQRRLLDRFAGDEHRRQLALYREVHARWRDRLARLQELETGARDRAREVARLRHEVAEINAARIDPGADVQLETELDRLEHARSLAHAASTAAEALDEEGARGPVGVGVSALRREAAHDPVLRQLLSRLEGLAAELEELRRDLRGYAEATDDDPARLSELHDRRRVLDDLRRRYGPTLEDVLAYAADAERTLTQLDPEGDDEAALREEVAGLTSEVRGLAEAITTARRRASERLVDAVEQHLRDLAMPHARFAVQVQPAEEPGPHGADTVSFVLSPNPGEALLPVSDAASGGERSRVALAIEVALAEVDDARVLVFDEVDAGVGGAAAMAVGEKLAAVAAARPERQVLCVTHLAQIAAFADAHHVVEKGLVDERTVTTVRPVEAEDRPAEIARMTSGSASSGAAIEHARALLRDAAQRRGVLRTVGSAS